MGFFMKCGLPGRHSKGVFVVCIYFLLSFFASTSAYAYEQEHKISLTAKNISIASLFTEIHRQTGLYVFYNNDLLNDKEKVNVQFVDVPVEKAIQTILAGKNLDFNINNNYIVIFSLVEKKSKSVTIPVSQKPVPADTGRLKRLAGKVVSAEEGNSLQGASVSILHKQKGTSTNSSGEFAIEVETGDTLVITYIGKNANRIVYAGQKSVDIRLANSTDAIALEVVITGYQKIDKRKFTGASAKIKMDDIKQDGVTDVSRMMEGRVAGVSVDNVSGTFGAAPKIRIRGANSITGSNKPLWVVDNVILEDVVNVTNEQLASGDPTTMFGSSVAGINTNDIESIDILMDASATALYGARAMNGVVVITTKKGRATAPQINYSGTFSTILRPSYNKFNIMNSAQQMGVYREIGGSDFGGDSHKGWLNYSDISRSSSGGVYAKAADLITTYDETNGRFGLMNDVDSIAAFLRRYALANTDWFKTLFRNTLTQEHNISMSFGTDKAQSYLSANYYQDQGRTVGDKVSRWTGNFRTTYTPNKKMNIGLQLVGSYRQQLAPGTVDRVGNKVTGGYDRDFDINPFSYALNTSRTLTAYDENGNLEYFRKNYAPFNIINELQNNTLNVNMLDAKMQFELGYKITPSLKFDFTGAIRVVQTGLEHEITERSNMAEAYRANNTSYAKENNKFLYRDPAHPDDEPQVVLPKGGFYNRTDNKMLNYNVKPMLTYNRDFNSDNSLNVFGGLDVKSTNRRVSNSTGFGYQFEGGGIPFIDYRIVKQILEANFNYYGMADTRERGIGFFWNGSYTYKRRYTINVTVRDDGSNGVGRSKKSQWMPTWTTGASWNIYQEPFAGEFLSKYGVNRLILRGSYGLSADFGAANNSSVLLLMQTTKRPTLEEQEAGINLVSLENSELTWEKKRELNIGLDMGLFRDHLTFVINAWRKNTFDLISMIPTAGIGGQVYKPANYADLEAHGIDLTIGGRILENRNAFSWKANFTFGYSRDKVTRLKSLSQIGDLVADQGGTTLGYPQRSIFSIPFRGLDDHGVPLFINQFGGTGVDVVLQNSNTSNLKYEGPANPVYYGGLSNVVSYKNFSLNTLITYSGGNKVRLSPVFSSNYSDLNAMPKDFINRFIAEGDERITNVPSISDARVVYQLGSSSPYNIYNMSDIRVANGGFIRLKSVALTYDFPERFARKIGASNSSCTITGNNLWLIASDKKLKGQDPEFVNAGGVASPVFTQFSLAVKLGF